MSHLNLVQRYLSSLETFAPADEVGAFFTEDFTFHELPNRLVPEGRVRDRQATLAASEKAPKVLSSQRYVIRRVLEVGDTLALDLDWSGVLRVPVGNTAAGGTLQARFAAFLTLRDGRIAEQTNFDCYQPF